MSGIEVAGKLIEWQGNKTLWNFIKEQQQTSDGDWTVFRAGDLRDFLLLQALEEQKLSPAELMEIQKNTRLQANLQLLAPDKISLHLAPAKQVKG